MLGWGMGGVCHSLLSQAMGVLVSVELERMLGVRGGRWQLVLLVISGKCVWGEWLSVGVVVQEGYYRRLLL
jgi:hypothetical protein